MNVDQITIEVLSVFIPSLAVFLSFYLLLKHYLIPEHQRKLNSERISQKKLLINNKISAYERFALFLERIHPESMIMRLHQPGMSAQQLHAALLQNIRSEFEHNVVLQIYVSQQLWKLIKFAKDETVNLINLSAKKLKPNASAMDLSTEILQNIAKLQEVPTEKALDVLRKEVKQLYQ
ncbi:MAG: hypothetical protein D6707_09685, partial [Bacteroidetes bacterium]